MRRIRQKFFKSIERNINLKKITMDPFNLEEQYQFYLKKVGIKEEQMHIVQRVETRRAFMAGCVQILMLFTDKIADLDENEGVEKIDSLIVQASKFWETQEEEY